MRIKESSRIPSNDIAASIRWLTPLMRYSAPVLFAMIVLTVLQLVGLLKDKNPVVRQLAVENLLPYTQSGNPHIDIWKANNWEGGRMLKILVRDRHVSPCVDRK